MEILFRYCRIVVALFVILANEMQFLYLCNLVKNCPDVDDNRADLIERDSPRTRYNFFQRVMNHLR